MIWFAMTTYLKKWATISWIMMANICKASNIICAAWLLTLEISFSKTWGCFCRILANTWHFYTSCSFTPEYCNCLDLASVLTSSLTNDSQSCYFPGHTGNWLHEVHRYVWHASSHGASVGFWKELPSSGCLSRKCSSKLWRSQSRVLAGLFGGECLYLATTETNTTPTRTLFKFRDVCTCRSACFGMEIRFSLYFCGLIEASRYFVMNTLPALNNFQADIMQNNRILSK